MTSRMQAAGAEPHLLTVFRGVRSAATPGASPPHPECRGRSPVSKPHRRPLRHHALSRPSARTHHQQPVSPSSSLAVRLPTVETLPPSRPPLLTVTPSWPLGFSTASAGSFGLNFADTACVLPAFSSP